jgi:8-oxo-dGTP diphosphatase
VANKELYGRTFPIPEKIIKGIRSSLVRYPNSEGTKRAKFIVNNKQLTYQALKRIKNFFDNYNSERDGKERYELAGGNLMKDFIERTLGSNRKATEISKKTRELFKDNPNSSVKPFKLKEGVDIENKNAIIIVVNEDNEILLLKRSPLSDWGASRWAFVGGSIQKGETPKEACKREVKEETGLILDEIINVFNIQRGENTEYVFACRYLGDEEVQINKEHVDFGWFPLEDIKQLNKVSNLNDYLNIAFKNYN